MSDFENFLRYELGKILNPTARGSRALEPFEETIRDNDSFTNPDEAAKIMKSVAGLIASSVSLVASNILGVSVSASCQLFSRARIDASV